MSRNKDTIYNVVPGNKGFTALVLLLFFTVAAGLQNAQAVQNSETSISTLAQQVIIDRSDEVMAVSMDIQDLPLLEALEILTKKIGVGLSYSSDIDLDEKVSLRMHNVPFHEVLYALLEGTNLEPILPPTKDVLVIRAKEEVIEAEIYQETVSGQVVDAQTNELVPGVNIVIQGTTTGTTTDNDGFFQLTVPNLETILVVSFIGYQTQIVELNGRNQLEISLISEIYAGDEIVVVGYGAQTRATLTGSVSSIDGERIAVAPVTNISNALMGQVPGLVSLNATGEPGRDGATIRIRGEHTLGNNNPLIVIDGVPGRAGGLDRLNPEDIESISVLKDATAAIYGAQAANGVILITTKRGRADMSPQFSVNVNQAFNQPTRLPEMANAETYLRMRNEIDIYAGREPSFSEDRIQCHAQQLDPWRCPDTDWWGETFKPFSYQTRGDLSVSGGSQSIRYYLSVGGLTEDGFYRNSATQYDQYNFRSNIDAQVKDNITVNFNVSGRLEERHFPTRPTGEIFRMIQRGKPHEPAVWPDGRPGPDIEFGMNPVVGATPETGFDNTKIYYFQSNLGLDLEIPAVTGLSVRGNVAYDQTDRFQKVWQTPWTLYTWDGSTLDENGEPQLVGTQRGYSEPRLFQESGNNHDIMVNLMVNYGVDFQDHSFNTLVGYEQQTFTSAFQNAFRRYFSTDRIPELFAGGQDEQSLDGRSTSGARMNFFTRFNYNYRSKYLLEFVGRYDGSYIFPEDRRYGFFPAFSAGWRITQEDWFSDQTIFDELKLRASWGQTGNDRIDEFQYLATYGFGQGYVFGDGSIANSLFQTRIPNENIKWEVANQFDIGVEFQMLNNRLTVELDYFNYLRTDILWWRNASVPSITGFSLPRENIGEVASSGIDGFIRFANQFSQDLSMSVTLNGSYATNEIKFWDEAPGAPEWQRSTGSPMNTNLYYNAIGVFETSADVENYPSWPGARPGDIIFEDVNDDGVIDGRDRIRIDKTGLPKWMGGLNFEGTFRQFDFSVLFQGAAGAVQYIQAESGEIGNFFKDFADKRWTPENPNSEHPRAYNREDEYWASQANTYFLRNADYVRLKTVQIGYNLPANLSTQLGIQNLRVYASGFNLLTWDTLKVVDPEGRQSQGRHYPQKRTFNLGLSFSF